MIRAALRSAALTAALLLAPAAQAGGLMATDAWSPLAPPGAGAHAAYLTLANHSDRPRTLVGAEAEGYAAASLHESREVGGAAVMAPVDQLEIAPHGTVALAPGGLHVMLMRPAGRQKAGGATRLTLRFADGEALEVLAQVRDMRRDPGGQGHEMQGHDMQGHDGHDAMHGTMPVTPGTGHDGHAGHGGS